MRGAGAALLLVLLLAAPESAQEAPDDRALLVLVDGLTYEGALADPVIGSLARAGGIGLMTNAERLTPPDPLPGLVVWRLQADTAGRIADVLGEVEGEEALVIVAGAGSVGTATPIVLAPGRPGDLLEAAGEPSGLTSDTTRRAGVVSNLDVEPTIRRFLGAPLGQAAGSPIRVEGEAPTGLAERYGEWRRSAAPVGLAVLIFALSSLAAALVLVIGPWNGAGRLVSLWVLFSTAVLVALVPVGLLPGLRLPVVLPAIAVIAALLTAGALAAGPASTTRPEALVAGTGLALVVLDAAFGWPTGLTPLLGGSALEGVRFFGLGNPYAGIVLSGAVLVAALVRPWSGVALLLGAALFAGLPFLGADLGGGLTLFAAAAMWYSLRVRGRFGLREVALTAAALLAGLALLAVAHTLLPSPAMHVARTIEGAAPLELVEVFLRRLRLNLEATSAVPAAWLAVLGLPAWLAVAWRRPGRFREPLERDATWRHAAVVLAVGGMLGYVLNDTYGMAAVTFVFLSAAMVIPALRWTNG
ncbi:MAG: hypothetical protein ACRDHH_04615 [Actinomycetota bacterium]